MTFNDKRYLLCSIARKYASYKYEIDELINEAWLDRNVRKQAEAGGLWRAARWAMISYMKRQEKRNMKKWHIYTRPLIFGDNLVVEPEVIPFNDVDFEHDFEWLCKTLTPKQRLVVKLRMEGFGLQEIVKKMDLNCGRENVRQIWAKACDIMRIRYEKSCRDRVA